MIDKYLSRSCWIEIDLDSIKNNFYALKKMVGPEIKIMPAVKANAYHHGIVEVGKLLEECGTDYLGAGVLNEAIRLRKCGVKTPIMVFISNTVTEVANLYIEYDIMPTVRTIEQVEAISKAAGENTAKVFVKMETGRGRLGINAEEISEFVREAASFSNIKIEGIYSHMTCPDWPDKECYSQWQYERFISAVDEIEQYNIHIPFMQLLNSSGSIVHPDMRLTGICPGQAVWGYSTVENRPGHPELEPAIKSWKSKLISVSEVIGGKFGENFGAVKLDKPMRIGVMAGGMSDGISPLQAKGGYVLIRGMRVPVASSVCVEHTILDLTNCPEAQIGDEVVILGEQGDEKITAWDLMKRWNKSVPEFLVSLDMGVPRVYYRNGRPQSIRWMEENQIITEESY